MNVVVLGFSLDKSDIGRLCQSPELHQFELPQVVDQNGLTFLRAKPNVKQRHRAILESKLRVSNLQSCSYSKVP